MNKYFDTKIYDFKYKSKNIDDILQEENYLIVGDFWGIQSFIFDGLTTKNAAKVLRAKSAFVQIIMEVVAKYICDSAKVDDSHILTTNAGKFEVLLPTDIDITAIQQKLDDYFINNFYGISGIGLAKIRVNKNEWQKDYKNFREQVAKEVEKTKFKKFDLINKNPILEYDEGIDNQSLCDICNVRKKEDKKDECKVCDSFIKLGKRLANFEVSELVSIKKLYIDIFDDYDCDIVIDERLVSYVPTNDKNILTFEEIAQSSCKDSKTGIKALGILKADVDGMGNFIKTSNITNHFENFDEFSKGLDSFFSLYVTDRLKQDYKNIYTVFAGGDDLFLVGAWDEVMDFSRKIRDIFLKYIKNKGLTISFGIAIAKPHTPISYLANHTEELLELSKEIEGKDSLTIWGESVKWNSYIEIYKKLDKAFQGYEDIATTTIYRLLEFCNMSKNINKDIKNTIWKSKLNYLFSRNMNIEEDKDLMEVLSTTIDENPSETKVFLSEFIYKRRD